MALLIWQTSFLRLHILIYWICYVCLENCPMSNSNRAIRTQTLLQFSFCYLLTTNKRKWFIVCIYLNRKPSWSLFKYESINPSRLIMSHCSLQNIRDQWVWLQFLSQQSLQQLFFKVFLFVYEQIHRGEIWSVLIILLLTILHLDKFSFVCFVL